MTTQQEAFRSKVVLTAFGDAGAIVDQVVVDYDDFYGQTNTLIDDSERIKKENIYAITGEIYESSGELQSTFVNFYDANGLYVRSRAIHANGTVTQD
jgi:hypothetical protein